LSGAWNVLHGARPTKFMRSLVKNLDEYGFTPLDFAETILRGSAYSAGIDLALRFGLHGMDAQRFALKVVDRSMFTYDEFSRNAWFRTTLFGSLISPLTSFPAKQAGFIRRMMTEDASDGASPAVATMRYLFINGLVASSIREVTKAATGEEFVPRELQDRVELSILPWMEGRSVKAPEGFVSVFQFSPTRAPGITSAKAFYDTVTGEKGGVEFIGEFVKYFVPYGLLVDDVVRAKQRSTEGVTRQHEGVVQQIMRGGSTGAVVRESTETAEAFRLFSLVGGGDGARREMEQRTRDIARAEYAEDRELREGIDLLVRQYREGNLNQQQARGQIMQLSSTPAGQRAISKGGIGKSDLEGMSRDSLRRAWDSNIKWKQDLAKAYANHIPWVVNMAEERGLSIEDLIHLANVYKTLRHEAQVRQMIGDY